MKLFTLLTVSSILSGDDPFYKKFDKKCIEKEKKACGAEVLPIGAPLNDEQDKIFMCRLNAIIKCGVLE